MAVTRAVVAGALTLALAAVLQADEVDVPNTFSAGEPAVAEEVNANFEALEASVDDNAVRIVELESSMAPEAAASPLVLEYNGAALEPLRGVENGGLDHERGTTIQPRPLVVSGLPGKLPSLLEAFNLTLRFDGRVLRAAGTEATPLIALDSAFAEVLDVPAVGAGADPFLVSLTINAGSADVGPFPVESAEEPAAGSLYEPDVELQVGSLGVTAGVTSAEPVQLTHYRGARRAGSNPVLRVASEDADPFMTAFMDGRRLSDIALRYSRPDGTTVLEIVADTGYVVGLVPDYSGDGVGIELDLDYPGLAIM